ncbi:MAG TPA: DUF6538 domain-containing protein, partial [Desulfobacterales bacterium]
MKTARKNPSYLVRNPYSYCFRMVVPKDLQTLLGKRELRYTLWTGSLGVAKKKARYVAAKVQFLFGILRRGDMAINELTDDRIKILVNQYIKKAIDNWNLPFPEFPEPDDTFVPPTDYEGLLEYADSLDTIREGMIVDLSLGKFGMLEESIGKLLKQYQINEYDPKDRTYRKLCAEIHKAEIQLLPLQKRHILGDFSYKQELPSVFPDAFPQVQNSPAVTTEGEQPSESLQTVVDAFWNERKPSWKKRTRVDYRICREHLIGFLGSDTPIQSIDYPTGRSYKAHLQENGNIGKALSVSRINMYLGFASTLFNYAQKNHYININPFNGLQISDKKIRVDELRDVFDEQDLKKMFCESREYKEDKHNHAHNFWVPILGLYTGCRLEELCQLYVPDVIESDGIWCLNIEEDRPDKSVKTGEKRLVPLHPFLIEDLNFIGYVRSLDDQKGRVFPKLIRISHRYGHNIGQWFGRFKKRCGVSASPGKKTFHSFRHTVINHLKQKDVPEGY